MATRVAFAATHDEKIAALIFEEDPTQVAEAWTAAGGMPFTLTQTSGVVTWINPANVAYWHQYGRD
jgi:hypothetical protein